MKTQYLKAEGVKYNTYLRIALVSQVSGADPETIAWEDLKKLKVTLERPKVSGALVLDDDSTKKIYYAFDNQGRMTISLNSLPVGLNRITVVVAYGTETRAQYIFDIEYTGFLYIRPTYIDATLVAVETIGDGNNEPFDPSELELEIAGKADGSIYREGDNHEARITAHGLTLEQGQSSLFSIDSSGNLVLYNEGTPVVLTPAKLAQLIS